MHLDENQHQTILWSMLHEPGDALARTIFDLRGTGAIEDFKTGRAKRLWSELVALYAPEYLLRLPELLERIKLRIEHVSVPGVIERGIRWGARPVFQAELPITFGRLADLQQHAPYLLWVAGVSEVLENEFVAVVGTRNPSEVGLKNSAKLVSKLRMPIVSGGAKGIDAAAHRTALELGLPTIAYMAGGLDRAYPMENWELFHQMVRSGGALVSEMAPGTSPSKFRFLQRNRLIAAHGSYLVVVEAGYRSGSKNTAGHARGLGREVYAIAGSWNDRSSQGCNAMIREGLAKSWELGNSVEPSQEQKRVLDAMREGCLEPAEIARESGMGIADVIRALRSLRLSGEIA
jgi:DNA processing protein